MKLGNFRIGLRTLKTALAVMLCIILFKVTGRGTSMMASLTAVFTMRNDVSSSVSFGTSRIIGNVTGGALSLIYYLVQGLVGYHFAVELLMVPFLVATLIVINDGIDNNAGIIGGTATLLIIVLTIPETQTFGYALSRVFDTLIGTFVAIAVNYLIIPPPKVELKEIDKDIEKVARLENELTTLREKIADDNSKDN